MHVWSLNIRRMPRASHNGSEALDLWGAYGKSSVPVRPILRATAISLALHALMFAVFLAMPESEHRRVPRTTVRQDFLKKAVKLVAPRSLELTQRDPNQGKVSQQLDIRSALPQTPAPRAFRPPSPAGPAELPAPVLGPAPQIDPVFEVPQIADSASSLANVPRPPERPKLVLEDVSPAPPAKPPENPLIRAPRFSVDEAARATGAGANALVAPGQPGDPGALSSMQLKSDPLGVDFKPYMLQILTKVRSNWFKLIPSISRPGRTGVVQVEFAVNKRGEVRRLVIASGSGTPEFDRVAVASISASYPFPPLPAEYPGNEIQLRLAFTYTWARNR